MAFIHLCKFWVLRTTKQIVLTAYRVVDNPHATCSESPLLEPDTLSFFSHPPWGTVRRPLTILAPFLWWHTNLLYLPRIGAPRIKHAIPQWFDSVEQNSWCYSRPSCSPVKCSAVTSVGSLFIPLALLSTNAHTHIHPSRMHTNEITSPCFWISTICF